jgi:methyltransferase
VTLAGLFIVIFAPMLVEASVSNRHDRALRAAGAVEPPGDVYTVMQIAYPAAFVAMLGEGAACGTPVDGVFWTGASVFLAAKALKYWAVATLGARWTFRVLVPPGSSRIVSGPYRWLRHPNYAAVAGELAGTALMTHALIAGPLATVGFTALMVVRVRVEERALCRSRSIERR